MTDEGAPFSQLVGASVLSALGSLPVHIAPLIFLAIIADGSLTVSQVGWLLTARAFGELSASVLLPLLGLIHLGRVQAGLGIACLVFGFTVASLSWPVAIVGGFLIVGVSCGVLKFIGTIAASRYQDRRFAFAFRLALVLAVAGGMIGLLLAAGATSSYVTLLVGAMMGSTLMGVLGIVLYKSAPYQAPGTPNHSLLPKPKLAGLGFVYLFFVAISGFIAYSGHQALTSGMAFSETILAIGLVKLAAGICLGVASYSLPQLRTPRIAKLEASLLVAALWGVFLSDTIAAFVASFLLLELAVNSFSARLQAAAIERSPHFGERWLNSTILLGSACGPPLYGLSITSGMNAEFVVVSSAIVFIALFWEEGARRALRSP